MHNSHRQSHKGSFVAVHTTRPHVIRTDCNFQLSQHVVDQYRWFNCAGVGADRHMESAFCAKNMFKLKFDKNVLLYLVKTCLCPFPVLKMMKSLFSSNSQNSTILFRSPISRVSKPHLRKFFPSLTIK